MVVAVEQIIMDQLVLVELAVVEQLIIQEQQQQGQLTPVVVVAVEGQQVLVAQVSWLREHLQVQE